MDRWQLLRTKRLSVYINRINMPDYDDLPHNHPWPVAYSLKLKGSYIEAVHVDRDVFCRVPGRFSRIPAVHRIIGLSEPCWTLFIGFNRLDEDAWGFVKPDGTVIPHRVRKAERGVTSEI